MNDNQYRNVTGNPNEKLILKKGIPTLRFKGFDLISVESLYIIGNDEFNNLSELEKLIKERNIPNPIYMTDAAWHKYESMLFDEIQLREFVIKGELPV